MPKTVEFNCVATVIPIQDVPANNTRRNLLCDRMADRSDTPSHGRGLASTQCSRPVAVYAQMTHDAAAGEPPIPTPATGVWQSGQ